MRIPRQLSITVQVDTTRAFMDVQDAYFCAEMQTKILNTIAAYMVTT